MTGTPDTYRLVPADAATTLDAAMAQLGLGRLNGPIREAAAAELREIVQIDRSTGQPFALDDAGNRRVVIQNGQATDAGAEGLLDVVRELVAKHGAVKAPAAAPASSSTFESLTERMIRRRAQETGDLRRQAEAEAATHGNPWASGRENLTLRMALTRHAPEVAERLKREAGITP